MKPVPYKYVNCTFGKDQKDYQTLPAFRDESGNVITKWKPSWKDRLRILFGGSIWLSQLTWNKPLQPILVVADPNLLFDDTTNINEMPKQDNESNI